MTPDPHTYLSPVLDALEQRWPENRTVCIACHGHSVPAGYFATPYVDTLHAYPQQLLAMVKERFPFAVVNVVTTAIGGETAVEGAARFTTDVLSLRPDVVTIDYGLNDRYCDLSAAWEAWKSMIAAAQRAGVKPILLTPSWDISYYEKNADWDALCAHAQQIRSLAAETEAGLCDVFRVFERYIEAGGALADLLSHQNHPGQLGHRLIAQAIGAFFPAR